MPDLPSEARNPAGLRLNFMTRLCFAPVWFPVLATTMAMAQDRIVLLNDGDRTSAPAARSAWQPVEHGTPPVDIAEPPPSSHPESAGSKAALKLVCNFKTNAAWRVAWDHAAGKGGRPARWDLSACQTIRLHVIAHGDRPAGMILYLHSGDGWYGTHFAALPDGRTVELPRKKFTTEDNPGGWERIDRIRLAVLRDEPEDRAVLVGDIEGVARPAGVVIYRNGAGLKVEPSVPEVVRQMGDALDRLAIAYEIAGDDEVAAGRLAGRKVAILPLNPVLPKSAAAAVEGFVAGGGKLIVCYCSPPPLDKLLGMKSVGTLQGGGKDKGRLRSFTFESAAGRQPIAVIQDSWIAHRVTIAGQPPDSKVRALWTAAPQDGTKAGPSAEPAVTGNANGFFIGHVLTSADQPNKDRLIQEMIGELWPRMWEDVYRARKAELGRVAGFRNKDELVTATAANLKGQGKHATEFWQDAGSADATLADAERAAGRKDFAAAAALMSRAQEAFLRLYASSVPGKPGEFRAVWCHSPTGVAGMTWDQALKRLADCGFNALIVNMCWGDSAAYESRLLPRAAGIDRDQLADCLAAANKHGLAVHVWRVDWNLGWNADPKIEADLRAAGRLQQDRSGTPINWLCPSNPDNQKLEIAAMLEIARNYRVAGVHFDYIRYPGERGCFCAGCRKRFEAREGRPVKNWPADVTAGPLREEYLQFRRDNITRVVAAVSPQARQLRPGIKVSAAVFPDWSSARNEVGQDWKLWVEKGYLDFVCPMQYTDEPAMFEAMTRRNARLVGGKTPLVPGIGATLGNRPDGTLEQVLLARKNGGAGFVLFNYDRGLLEHLDLLKLGATRTGETAATSRPAMSGR